VLWLFRINEHVFRPNPIRLNAYGSVDDLQYTMTDQMVPELIQRRNPEKLECGRISRIHANPKSVVGFMDSQQGAVGRC
jgi:hypothetical protein